jgi:hypothetical protein
MTIASRSIRYMSGVLWVYDGMVSTIIEEDECGRRRVAISISNMVERENNLTRVTAFMYLYDSLGSVDCFSNNFSPLEP